MNNESNEPKAGATPEYFLVIGQEDSSHSIICDKTHLVDTILELVWNDPKDATEDERKHWEESVSDKDNWSRDESYFHQGLGEIGHIYIHRINDTRNLATDHGKAYAERLAAAKAEVATLQKRCYDLWMQATGYNETGTEFSFEDFLKMEWK